MCVECRCRKRAPIPPTADALQAHAATLQAQLSAQTQQVEAQAAQIQQQIAQIATQTTQLKHLAVYIEKLQFELARLKRWRFGAASEAVGSEQIALWEAELDGDIAAAETRLEQLAAAAAPGRALGASQDSAQAQAAARYVAAG